MGVFWVILGCFKGQFFKTKVLGIGKKKLFFYIVPYLAGKAPTDTRIEVVILIIVARIRRQVQFMYL